MINQKINKISEAGRQAKLVLAEIKDKREPDIGFMERKFREFMKIKLMLDEEEVSDNITLMAQISVAKALNIPVTMLPGVDVPGQCGGVTAVLSKRIQLFLDVQKSLDIQIEPKLTPGIQTIHDLAEIVERELRGNKERGGI